MLVWTTRRPAFPQPLHVRSAILRRAVLCLAIAYALAKFVTMRWGQHTFRGESRKIPERTASLEVSTNILRRSTVLLVALRDGPEQEAALSTWSRYTSELGDDFPPVSILCDHNSAIDNAIRVAPNLQPFYVDRQSSWAEALEQFLVKNRDASTVGLLGEGSLPYLSLPHSINSLTPALAGSTAPTAIVVRSRSGTIHQDGVVESEWLPDTLVAQVWCNLAMLAPSRLVDPVLQQRGVHKPTLLAALPTILGDPSDAGVVLVDGTPALASTVSITGLYSETRDGAYSTGSSRKGIRSANAPSSAAPALYIGTLAKALIFADDENNERDDGHGRDMFITEAPWPPAYVLETVATQEGMVLVTSVNCGYLDMAMNLLRSVRSVGDVKVGSLRVVQTILLTPLKQSEAL